MNIDQQNTNTFFSLLRVLPTVTSAAVDDAGATFSWSTSSPFCYH